MKLSPLFSYFGSKFRSAGRYPAPRHSTIIEPFAGSAGYSLNFADKNIVLYDLDSRVIDIWNYLITTKELDFIGLPSKLWKLDEVPGLSETEKLLIGSWLDKGTTLNRSKRTEWSLKAPTSHWGDSIKFRIASQLKYIRHWKAYCGSYEDIPNQEATWFIDPPYQKLGKFYKKNEIDFSKLAEFCQSRQGQVIVAEQKGADWLPFRYLGEVHSVNNRTKKNFSSEVIWTND